MTPYLPTIGLPVDVKFPGGEPFHCVGEKYIAAVAAGARAIPALLPALGAGEDMPSLHSLISVRAVLERLDGLFIPGSPSNLAPTYYGDQGDSGEYADPQRDQTTLPLIREALAMDLPLLAVCRGHQELNVALGGTLCQAVHEQPERLDHREDKTRPRPQRYAPVHTVRLRESGPLAELAGAVTLEVNSLHGQGIDRLGHRLTVEATAPDGLVEAVSVDGASFALGIQWHPEWVFQEDPFSTALFRAFGDAARAYAQRRPASAPAASTAHFID